FLCCAEFCRFAKRRAEGGEECLAFRIVSDRHGQLAEAFEVVDFLLNGLPIGLSEYFGRGFIFVPLFCDPVQRFEVFLQRFFEWVRSVGLSKALTETMAHRIQCSRNREGGRS